MIGDNIKKIREEKNMSLSELAAEAGVSKSYLFNIEHNNQKNPSIYIVKKLAEVLKVDPFILSENLSEKGSNNTQKNAESENEKFFKLKKNIEELHPNQLEEVKNYIDYIMWKKGRNSGMVNSALN